jgi:hypothetical protein
MIEALLVVAVVSVAGLLGWRVFDLLAVDRAWRRLAQWQPAAPRPFDAGAIAQLPEPARRFFSFAIEPGTPLYPVAEITMQGEIGLGSRQRPGYRPMRARQISASPHGFVWRVSAGRWLRIAGSDGATEDRSWSRFWLCGIVPVARAGDDADHLRSAFGRCVAEALFWTPAALLVDEGVRWEQIGDDSARVTVTRNGRTQSVDVEVDQTGRPVQVAFSRWSDANEDKVVYRLQPFGGHLSEFRVFGGYRLPTRVDAGNFFDTPEYFPFFRAEVTSVRFPRREAEPA